MQAAAIPEEAVEAEVTKMIEQGEADAMLGLAGPAQQRQENNSINCKNCHLPLQIQLVSSIGSHILLHGNLRRSSFFCSSVMYA